MYYEINVSLFGRHFFATHARSITTREECKRVVEVFKKAFPKENGYLMNILRYELVGEPIHLKDL
jgi:hypothetical protein